MNKDEKTAFVKELLDALKHDIVTKIIMDKIPEEWDGLELRQYIADQVNAYKMGRQRMAAYKNEVLIRNL